MSVANGPSTVASLLADSILIVPPYQRAYAWDPEPHLRNFIEDLRRQPSEANRKYFFGTILLAAAKQIKGHLLTGYAIVDGQQRLTTSCIFAAAALSRLRPDVELAKFVDLYYQRFIKDSLGTRKFHTINEDDGFFERFIIGDEIGSDAQCETPSQRRLLSAKRFFYEKLGGISAAETNKLLTVLLESEILLWSVNSDLLATQIFELQNDRGKRLTDLEALKSFLMHGIYLYSGSNAESDLNILQKNFAAIYRAAEKMEARYDSPDEDQLLSYHCIAFEPSERLEDESEGWRKPKQLVRLILEKSQEEKSDWIKNFSHRLRDSYEFALQIIEARDQYRSIDLGHLTAIGRTAALWPLLLKCWKHDQKPGHPGFNVAVGEMAKFAFRAIIAGKRADTGDADLRRKAREFCGDFRSLTAELKGMREWWNMPVLFAMGLDSEDFYNEDRAATYLLWRYENYLRTQPGKQAPRLQWDTIVAPTNSAVKYQKDHIEPKDPANPNVRRLVKWSPKDEQTRPFEELFLHRLGNLVLDTFSTGGAKGNRDFAARIHHYTQGTFLSQHEIVTRFASRNEDGTPIWDEDAIRRRHAALVDFATNEL
jgi:hypothetical protein